MSQQARKGGSVTRGARGAPARPPDEAGRGRAPRPDGTHTAPAGEGVSDDEMARQVTDQTSHDRVAATFFEGERGGARSEEEAAKFRDPHRHGSPQPTGV